MMPNPSLRIVTNIALISSMTYQLIRTTSTIAGIAYLTNSPISFPSALTGVVLSTAPASIVPIIFSLRFIILSGRLVWVGLEWQNQYNNLPTEPYNFTAGFNSTCPTPSLKAFIDINFPEPNSLDRIIASHNFRPFSLLRALEDRTLLQFIQSIGIFVALENEWHGTHALLKDIKSYSASHNCPTISDRNKILEFAGLDLLEANIRYAAIDLWTQPINMVIKLNPNDYASFFKGFSNVVFHYTDTYNLMFFQKLVKVALIPYSQAYCPVVIDNGLAADKYFDTEKLSTIDDEWHHQEVVAPQATTIKCDCFGYYAHNNCIAGGEALLEVRRQTIREHDFITLEQKCPAVISTSDKNQCAGCIEELVVEYKEWHHQTMWSDGAILE